MTEQEIKEALFKEIQEMKKLAHNRTHSIKEGFCKECEAMLSIQDQIDLFGFNEALDRVSSLLQ